MISLTLSVAGCGARVAKKTSTLCDQREVISYQERSDHLGEYVDDFIREISKINRLRGDFQLEIRRSQVMIAFGEDLIRRLDSIESSLTCDALQKRYLSDREVIFNKLEGLIKSQSN